jgi:hypothetical protein
MDELRRDETGRHTGGKSLRVDVDTPARKFAMKFSPGPLARRLSGFPVKSKFHRAIIRA